MTLSRLAPLALWLGLFGLFGLFAHGYLENADADITMHSARAIWVRGSPALLREGADTSVGERFIATEIHSTGGLGDVGRDGEAQTLYSIGHQLIMVPLIAIGEVCAAYMPGPERVLHSTRPPLFAEFFWARFLISFLPAAAAATAFVALLRICRAIGCSASQALLTTLIATLCSQFWPGASRETMSDGPGMALLFWSVALAVERHAGMGSSRRMLIAGAFSGAAVIVRYPHALLVTILGLFVAWTAWRQRRPRDLLGFVAGGVPFAMLLAGLNWWRFGDVMATGYTADPRWWSYPIYLGAPLILLAPGKGALWFSLPIWFALSECVRRRLRHAVLVMAAAMFLAAVLFYGRTHGWAGGQCWGARYITPPVVLLIAVGLGLGQPWRRAPRRFFALCAIGLTISVGGVLTPYRGHQHLAIEAARCHYSAELAAGAFDLALLPDRTNVHPRFSPIHTHWIYAWHSMRGQLSREPSTSNRRLVFGVEGEPDGSSTPFLREDLGMRHQWLAYLHDVWPVAWRQILVGWILVTAVCLGFGLRAWLRLDPRPDADSPALRS